MARTGNPERKGELLDLIMDYLVDVPLAQASFRALADALGVSTFALVYHFGNREQLDREILGIVGDRQKRVVAAIADGVAPRPESLVEAVEAAWSEQVSRRGRLSSRLSFEAGVVERLRGGPTPLRDVHLGWIDMAEGWLVRHGAEPEAARLEAEVLVSAWSGLHYRLLLDGDEEAAARVCREALRRFIAVVPATVAA